MSPWIAEYSGIKSSGYFSFLKCVLTFKIDML